MAFNRFEVDEKEYQAYKASTNSPFGPPKDLYVGGLVGSQAAVSAKEGEITQRLSQLEMKVNVLHNNVCKVKDILGPILFDGPARLKNNVDGALVPDRTKVGGRINTISYYIDEIKAVVDDILEGIEI